MSHRMILIALLGCFLGLGCSNSSTANAPTSPSGTDPSVSSTVTIAAGQAVDVTGTPVTVRFAGVSNDSRCPADAFCIQLGEAVAVFEVSTGARGGTRLELRTSETGRRGEVGDYRFELVTLQPYPFSRQPIEPNDYRATLQVNARSDQ